MESMILEEEPWESSHQQSHHPNYNEDNPSELYQPIVIDFLMNSIPVHAVKFKRNSLNIEETIAIDI